MVSLQFGIEKKYCLKIKQRDKRVFYDLHIKDGHWNAELRSPVLLALCSDFLQCKVFLQCLYFIPHLNSRIKGN